MGITYRPEIDGLRAIAVLAVVLFHAGVGGAGFVGVDVFFVISGYLITSLLLKERDATGINLLAFYARRVRRIFPAAAVVVLAILAASSLLLSPLQQTHTANSAGAALVFVANVFFQLTSGGYFDSRAEEMPLLHLWSLSVEEQFYFLWPALLMLVPRQWLRPVMVGMALASLALAEYWITQGNDAAFYEMPARFWELAAGGLVAASPARALPRWTLPAGVLLTLAACAYPAGHFPGVGALPAILGACAIIAAVHGGARNALLASKPMVAVGLISYSLYLWHWPLLALHRAMSVGDNGVLEKLQLCFVAAILAVGSYRYVEQPFRKLKFRSGRTVAAGAILSSVFALSACAMGLHAGRELERQRTINPALAAATDKPSPYCHISTVEDVVKKCEPHLQTLVWGDSMAWSWTPAIPGASDVSMDSCAPFVGAVQDIPAADQCLAHNAWVAGLAADTVYLAARWNGYSDLSPLEPTLRSLRKVRRVVIIGPSPELRDLVPRCIERDALAKCAISRREFDAQARPILAYLRRIAARYPNVEVLDVSDHFCTATECPPVRDGVALYWDSHHVSATAARRFGERLTAGR